MKFEKRTAEVYLFTELPSGIWGKFTVDDMGTKGRISIASDYGDWQNGWNACGQGFKQFLCDINFEYASEKFNAGRWFDGDKTVERFKQDVLINRRSDGKSKEAARAIWDEIKQLADETIETVFVGTLQYECPLLMSYYDHCPDLSYGPSPSFKRFWRECWPLLTAELQRELKAIPAGVGSAESSIA